MIKGLYVISQAGVPIYSYNENETEDQDILFSGLITAIKKFLEEINVGQVRQFTTESHIIQIYSNAGYAVVFIFDLSSGIDAESGKKLYNTILEQLGDSIKMFEEAGTHFTDELETLLSLTISQSLAIWKEYIAQSKVSKKIQESLW